MNKTLKKIVTFLALPIIVPVVVGTMWLASRSDYKDFEKESKKMNRKNKIVRTKD